jgi:hypothetical protein
VAAWLAVNPVVFPKPANDRAWATRAILGEELWTSRRMDTAKGITVATSLSAAVAIVSSVRRRLTPAVAACAVQMALTLVYWEMMARYWVRHHTPAE